MKTHFYPAALLTGLIMAGAAPLAAQPAATPGDADCLQPIRLYDWKVLDNRTLIVTDKMHHDFKVTLMPGCQNLNFSFGLAFKPFSPSRLACMSKGDSVIVPPGGGLPRQTCFISSVQGYTPEMRHADAVAKAMDKPH